MQLILKVQKNNMYVCVRENTNDEANRKNINN